MKEAEFASMTWEEQEAYIASHKQAWDLKNTHDFAIQQGLQQGREQQANEIARRMLEEKFDLDTIVRISGLTEEQIRAL